MLILAVLAALVLGWCAGGRLSRFEGAGLRLLPLPVLALALQRLPGLLPPGCYLPWGAALLVLSYALLLLFLWKNRRLRKTAVLMGAGSLCNLLVIAANGWRMPVAAAAAAVLSPEGLARMTAGQVPMYALAGPGTRLLFLGDVLYCPLPFLRGFASVGDLLLTAGVFFCLMAVMAPGKLPCWLSSG